MFCSEGDLKVEVSIREVHLAGSTRSSEDRVPGAPFCTYLIRKMGACSAREKMPHRNGAERLVSHA